MSGLNSLLGQESAAKGLLGGVQVVDCPSFDRLLLVDGLHAEIARGRRAGLAFNSSDKPKKVPKKVEKWLLDWIEPVVYNPVFTKGIDPDFVADALSHFNYIHQYSPELRPGGSLCDFAGLDPALAAATTSSPVSNTGGKSSLGWGNMGGKSSLLGRWKDDGSRVAYPVCIDALTFTLPGSYLDCDVSCARHWVERWSHDIFTIGGRSSKRFNGYPECYDIVCCDGGPSPFLGWVGVSWVSDNMRGRWCFCLSGVACSCINDWSIFHADCEPLSVRLTRVDVAVDDIYGEHSLMGAYQDWKAEKFCNGGRNPKSQMISNSDNSGDTFYVGARGSGKMLRVYEKGKQLGDKSSPWVRFELELHHKDRVIPWDILLNPACYLRGSYPEVLSWVAVLEIPISTVKNRIAISFKVALQYASRQVGRIVNYCKDKAGMDFDEIVSALSGKPGCYPFRLFEPVKDKVDMVVDGNCFCDVLPTGFVPFPVI
jgi:DNA relaxase NicK